MALFIQGRFLVLLIQRVFGLGKVMSIYLTVQTGSGLFIPYRIGCSEGAKQDEKRVLALFVCTAWDTAGSGGYGVTLDMRECVV